MTRKKRPLDWLATALFFGVAVAALASFSRGAAAYTPPEGWYCPDEFDYHSRLTGFGWDEFYASRACEQAEKNLTKICKDNGADHKCCDMADCDVSCLGETHVNCHATQDGWPYVYHVIIDGGGDGGGSGSGN